MESVKDTLGIECGIEEEIIALEVDHKKRPCCIFFVGFWCIKGIDLLHESRDGDRGRQAGVSLNESGITSSSTVGIGAQLVVSRLCYLCNEGNRSIGQLDAIYIYSRRVERIQGFRLLSQTRQVRC